LNGRDHFVDLRAEGTIDSFDWTQDSVLDRTKECDGLSVSITSGKYLDTTYMTE